MYCVTIYRNSKQLDKQVFDTAEKALNNMMIMIMAAALSCDDIPNITASLIECEITKKKKESSNNGSIN